MLELSLHSVVDTVPLLLRPLPLIVSGCVPFLPFRLFLIFPKLSPTVGSQASGFGGAGGGMACCCGGMPGSRAGGSPTQRASNICMIASEPMCSSRRGMILDKLRHDGAPIPLTAEECGDKGVGDEVECQHGVPMSELRALHAVQLMMASADARHARRDSAPAAGS